jgi:hypothetical protein
MEEEQLSHLQEIIDAAENSEALNDWEKGFLADQIGRFKEYGDEIRMSPKQWGVLEKIWDKVK